MQVPLLVSVACRKYCVACDSHQAMGRQDPEDATRLTGLT
jgi:hypothetical protein